MSKNELQKIFDAYAIVGRNSLFTNKDGKVMTIKEREAFILLRVGGLLQNLLSSIRSEPFARTEDHYFMRFGKTVRASYIG